jgi:hypothetical protein
MKKLSSDIADSIVTNTVSKLSDVSNTFEKQMITLKSHTEGISTYLSESETRLDIIKDKSEFIIKQMGKIDLQSTSLNDIKSNFKDIVKDMQYIKEDYVKAQFKLNIISSNLKASQEKDMVEVKEQVEVLVEGLTAKIEDSLEKFNKHYSMSDENISKSVQLLAKQAQVKKGYSE